MTRGAPATITVVAANSYRARSKQLLHESLFEAARRELDNRPWLEITMADIASAAGVSRQTLYNEFGSRDEFAQAFVITEGARFLDEVEQAIAENAHDGREALGSALEHFLESASHDPFVRMLVSDDGTGGLLPLVTTQSQPVVGWAAERLAGAIEATWPRAKPRDVALLAETLVRLAISYVTSPAGTPRQTARAAVRLLGPFVDQALAQGGAPGAR